MLATVALLATLPVGTITPVELCRWLSAETGKTHAVSGELRDYPLFVSLHAATPTRVEKLVSNALAAQWEQDGKTIRLAPLRPREGEGYAEFERAYRAAVPPKSALAGVPIRDIFALKAGRILRYGWPETGVAQPLPPDLKAKVMASEGQKGYVYLRRFSNGVFETHVTMPGENREVFSGDSQIEFRSLPPAVMAALGDEAKVVVFDADAKARLNKLSQDPNTGSVDPKKIDQIDPLANFMDPVLKPVAKALKKDLIVALPDFSIMAMMGSGAGTVENVFQGFSQTVDWIAADGALVGRLPVSERLNRAQTRRSVLGSFILNTRTTGIPGPEALSRYLAAQRPQASESWSDVMMLVMAGLVIDETHLGDHPFNLRLGAAMSGRDWDLLRTGRPVTMADLSPNARIALIELLAQSRERMMGREKPDPALWQGFPNVRVAITAKVETEPVVIGYRAGVNNIIAMTPTEAGYGYDRLKASLGKEPLYRPAERRKILLTITQVGSSQSVETGFGEITMLPGAKEVAWEELPQKVATAFEGAMKSMRESKAAQP